MRTQLDQVTGETLARAWAAGVGPGDGPLTIDVDSTICEVHGYHKQGACYGYTHRLGLPPVAGDQGRHWRGAARPAARGRGHHRPRDPPIR
jgi:hypothetical protein